VWKLLVVIVVAVVMMALMLLHVRGVNGPWYWRWAWRRLGWETYALIMVASLPLFVAHALYARGRIGVRGAIVLIMLAALCLQIAAILRQPLGLARVAQIVQSPATNSYYTVAKMLHGQMEQRGVSARDWLEIYPQLMDSMVLHASFKPPGWILYYLGLMGLFGGPGPRVAVIGGWIVAVLATTAIPMTYRLARFFGIDELPALCAASYFALTPSLLLFLPQHDQTYPALACLMLITWVGSLRGGRGSRWLAVAFGALLALATFLSAVFLMLGLFCAVWTLLYLADRRRRGIFHVLVRATLVLITFVALYVLLYFATGFDPIDTFFTANRRSQAHLVELQRPWPLHTLWDLVDIAMGTGWISAPLIAWGVAAALRAWPARSPQRRLVLVGLLQVLMAVAVAVFPGENARLMLPIIPLLMMPIGIELSRWPMRGRMVVFALLVVVTATVAQNMVFLYMGQEIDIVPR
jgi:hypothetical protein